MNKMKHICSLHSPNTVLTLPYCAGEFIRSPLETFVSKDILDNLPLALRLCQLFNIPRSHEEDCTLKNILE
jgi:hypothetical protein